MERLTRPDGSPVSFLGQPQTDVQAEELLALPDLPDFLRSDATPEMIGQSCARTLYRARRGMGDSIDDALLYALLARVGRVSVPSNRGEA